MEEIIENIIEEAPIEIHHEGIISLNADSPVENKAWFLKAALSTFNCCSEEYVNEIVSMLEYEENEWNNPTEPVKAIVDEPIDTGLSTEAKVGLVLGGLALAAGIGYGVYKWFKKRNDDSQENPSV